VHERVFAAPVLEREGFHFGGGGFFEVDVLGAGVRHSLPVFAVADKRGEAGFAVAPGVSDYAYHDLSPASPETSFRFAVRARTYADKSFMA
jgi:hypothetical protein